MERESNRESGPTDTEQNRGGSGTATSTGHFSSAALHSLAANCHEQLIIEAMRLEQQDN